VKTSCTPVAIITGTPKVFSNDANKADDQKDLIDRIRKLPAERLLPRPSGFDRVVSSASQYVNDAMRELMDLIRDGT
jgi:histone H3/H4